MSKQVMADIAEIEDIDLMLYLDGEIDDEATCAAIAEKIASEPDTRAKVESLRQMDDVLRTYVELATDDKEDELGAMWATIERRIRTNGMAETQAATQAAERAVPTAATEARKPGLWAAIAGWFEQYRGHILTGAVAVGAAALLVLALRSSQTVIVEKPQPTPVNNPEHQGVGPTVKPQPMPVPLAEEPRPPEVTDLDVADGSGSVFVMPSEGDDDVSATVVFIDMNDVEGPL